MFSVLLSRLPHTHVALKLTTNDPSNKKEKLTFYSSFGGETPPILDLTKEFKAHIKELEDKLNDKKFFENHIRANLIAFVLKNSMMEDAGVSWNKTTIPFSLEVNEESLKKFALSQAEAYGNGNYSPETLNFFAHTYSLSPFDIEKDNKKFGEPTRLRLPSIQEGFTHGINEEKAIHKMEAYRVAEGNKGYKKYQLFNRNCADAAMKILASCSPPGITITSNATKILNIISNPNIPNPFALSVGEVARHLRQAILEKTIRDPTIPAQDKIKQVLDMEIMRLEDGIDNIKGAHPLVRLLHVSQIKIKEAKLAALKHIKSEIDAAPDKGKLAETLNTQINAQRNILKSGLTRAKTLEHLTKLADSLKETAKKCDASPEEHVSTPRWGGLR